MGKYFILLYYVTDLDLPEDCHLLIGQNKFKLMMMMIRVMIMRLWDWECMVISCNAMAHTANFSM